MKKLLVFLAVVSMLFAVTPVVNAGGVNAMAGAGASVEQNFEASEIPQSFANGVETTYPGLPGHLGPDQPDGSVIPLNLVVNLKPTWMRTVLEANTEGSDIKFRTRSFVRYSREDEKPNDTIDIILGLPKDKEVKLVGVITAEADDVYTTNLELMSEVALQGLKMNADAICIVVDGASKVTKTKGWGIGLNHSTATVNGNGDIGTVTTGGTGYSSGQAGYRQIPWIQVFAVRY
jgi:hypothetical protein